MSRIKTVFDTRQCAHVWAQQTQAVGRNASSSVSFEGATFYSYQTPIATIVESTTHKGMRVALVSSEGYSITTKSKHLPAARSAVANFMAMFHVPFVFPHGRGQYRLPLKAHGTVAQTWRAIHEANCAYLNHNYTEQVESFMRERTWRGSDDEAIRHVRGYLREITDIAERYARLFDIPSPHFPIEADAARIIARRQRIDSDPKRAAKRAAREAREEAIRLEAARRNAEANAERVAKFRAGEQVGTVSDEHGCAMLRVSKDGTEVETSWGARAPVSDVRRALKLYSRVWWRGQPAFSVPRDFADAQLGSFRLDMICVTGDVKAGCHTITAGEVARLRAELEAREFNVNRAIEQAWRE